jgi:hypothetical protein
MMRSMEKAMAMQWQSGVAENMRSTRAIWITIASSVTWRPSVVKIEPPDAPVTLAAAALDQASRSSCMGKTTRRSAPNILAPMSQREPHVRLRWGTALAIAALPEPSLIAAIHRFLGDDQGAMASPMQTDDGTGYPLGKAERRKASRWERVVSSQSVL